MTRIELSELRKNFGTVTALDDVGLSVETGENVVVLGPSGSGKSTLLRVIAGLEDADGGRVTIGGRDQAGLAAHQRDVAIVFQHFALYPHLSALTNITLGLRHGLRLPVREAKARARDVAERLEISTLLDRLPKQMSGGQRQRVALARALARQAGVVLLDEPLSGLDAQLRQSLRVEINAVLRATGATTIHVTHDQLDAMAMADRIVILRDGRIEQLGTADDLYQRPVNQFVAGFVGSPPMNLFTARRGTDGYATPFGQFEPTEHDHITLGVRPEALRMATGEALRMNATVSTVEATGPDRVIHAQAENETRLAMRCSNDITVAMGDRITIGCDPSDVHVFDGTDGHVLGTVQHLLRTREVIPAR